MARRRKGKKVDGWINLDKPVGMSSTQAMAKVRGILKAQKAGHAGTLDPLASGILPIALGEATKTISYIQDSLKIYSFTIAWGEERSTDDKEGDVTASSDKRPAKAEIEAKLPAYTGAIMQTPPKFSAIKIDGQRAYDLARDGEDVELEPREVYIESLTLLDARQDEADFVMKCGKGTYVRSLGRDLARTLGTYGHIAALRRDQVGPFALKTSISLDKLRELADSPGHNLAVLPLQTALDDIPGLALREEEAARLRNGQTLAFISRPDFERLAQAGVDQTEEGTHVLASLNGKPIAIVEAKGAEVKPVRVFNI
jgi:tRNA pseudouridine55 synthase